MFSRLTQPIPNSASFIIHYLHSSRSFYFISFPLFSFYIEYHEQKTAVYFILDFMINAMDPPLYFGIKFGKCLYTTFYLNHLREKGKLNLYHWGIRMVKLQFLKVDSNGIFRIYLCVILFN